ncbi:MAG: hypothetical protein OXG56_11150 [Gammaproteobacteria bacterium]|nr:hypothetical protein [Gammaproteobacteria bacterium]
MKYPVKPGQQWLLAAILVVSGAALLVTLTAGAECTSPSGRQDQAEATETAAGFVEAVRDRIDRAGKLGNRLDKAEFEHFRRWVGGPQNTMPSGVTQDLTAYIVGLSNRYLLHVDGVGRAEVSNTLGTAIYRFGQRDCRLFLNKLSQGWRVTSTDCRLNY